METGHYYLHTNNTLQLKNTFGTSKDDLEESDFVRKYWLDVDLGNPIEVLAVYTEAYMMSADLKDLKYQKDINSFLSISRLNYERSLLSNGTMNNILYSLTDNNKLIGLGSSDLIAFIKLVIAIYENDPKKEDQANFLTKNNNTYLLLTKIIKYLLSTSNNENKILEEEVYYF